jgi:hypothetical protein
VALPASGLAIQQRQRATALETLARLRKEARAEIERLIDFLDVSDPYLQNEAEPDGEGDDSDDEPSLGSFDRMTNQDKAWRCASTMGLPRGRCREDADREDDDPAEESEPSGIGDYDGILEQVGWCDNTVMA